MSPFLPRASSASGSVVLTLLELIGSFFAASLGSMAAGTRSAPRSVRGGGSTRKPGVVAAGAPGFDWQAGISTVGRVVGDSTTTGATSAADGPVGKAVKAAFAEGVALGRVSRGGFSSAGMAAAGTGAGTNAGTHGATGAVAEAGSVGGGGVALGRVSRGGFSSAGMAAAGTGAGTNAGTHGATGAVAEAGSVGGVRAASGVVPSWGSVTSTCSLAACSW